MQTIGSKNFSPLSTDAEGYEAAIYVCNLRELPAHIETLRPSRLISLVPGYEQPQTPAHLKTHQHLRLELDDIAAPLADHILPEASHVRRLVDFAIGWEGDAPLLIHCAAGISRSTATAYITACIHNPSANEAEIAQKLRDVSPTATPNRRFIALAARKVASASAIISRRHSNRNSSRTTVRSIR